MSETLKISEYKKFVKIWEDAECVIKQESIIICETTIFFKKKSDLLDESINRIENNILRGVSQIIAKCFSLIPKIFIVLLHVAKALFFIIIAIAKTLFFIVILVVELLFFMVIYVIGVMLTFIWGVIIDIFIFTWEKIIDIFAFIYENVYNSLLFIWKLNDFLVKIKLAIVKHTVKKSLKNIPILKLSKDYQQN